MSFGNIVGYHSATISDRNNEYPCFSSSIQVNQTESQVKIKQFVKRYYHLNAVGVMKSNVMPKK